jgi:hypothetical protein
MHVSRGSSAPDCSRSRCLPGRLRIALRRRSAGPATLEAKAPDAVGFYSIIAGATVVGLALGYTQIDPIRMLIWSAVLNGIIAVPIMAVMMVSLRAFR